MEKLMDLEKSVKEILLNEWDPIGVKNNPKAKSEYDSYALRILGMLANGTDEGKIEIFLTDTVTKDFELKANTELTRAVSKKLISLKKSK
jgi:hypothetical protein